MYIKNWRREILTIPNLLSLFRLALIPVYIRLYVNARDTIEFFNAGAVMTISCLTDAADGYIARKFNMISTVGKILDPLADKMTQFSLTVCLSLRFPVLNRVLVLFTLKEVFQLIAGAVHLSHGKILPGALISGKICTAVLFSSLITLVLLPDLNPAAVNGIALADSIFLIISFAGYFSAYFGPEAKIQDLGTE